MAGEGLRPVYDVSQELTGKRPHPGTVWRWIKKGVAGVKLEATFVHCSWHTTPEQFRAFMRAMTKTREGVSSPKSAETVSDKQLAAAGLL